MSLETANLKAQLEKTRKILLFCGVLEAVVLAILFSLGLSQTEGGLAALLATLVILAIGLQLESYARTQAALFQQSERISALLKQNSAQSRQDYRQIEALFSIFSLLKLNHPLPTMREWAISPDLATLLISLVHERQPKLVVEASSGVSTLIVAYCLQQIGAGQVIALEHEAQYADAATDQVARHRLQNIAKVIHAPLTPVTIADQTWQWYDLAPHQDLLQPIDLLIIDGPPGDLQPQSRYPALPLLFHALSEDAVIVLDDGDRPDEQAIVARWQQDFPGIQVQTIANEKGAFVLRVRRIP